MILKCKCGSIKNYLQCCGKYIDNNELPNTPEELMRSRYTAYALGNIEYIANTMQEKALEGFDIQETIEWSKSITWNKLKVIKTYLNDNNHGIVEFKAFYTSNNHDGILYEKSNFKRINNKWFYTDGIIFNN